MKKDDIKFEIDQLRKDKIIYATESVAVSAACAIGMVILMVSPSIIPFFQNYQITSIIAILISLIGIGYALFMGIGNFYRLKRIRELEKILHTAK